MVACRYSGINEGGMMSEESVKLTVRLPAQLHRALKERAAEYNVSLNQAMVDTLAASLVAPAREETDREKAIRVLEEAGMLSDTASLIYVPEGTPHATLEEVREWLKGVPLSDWIIEDRGPR
jgi:hypothetical protein